MTVGSASIPAAMVCRDVRGDAHLVSVEDLSVRIAGYVAVRRGDCLLLVLESASGRWDLPGGGAEAGEPPAEAASRELREETGYAVAASALSPQMVVLEPFFDLDTGAGSIGERHFFSAVDVVECDAGSSDLRGQWFHLNRLPPMHVTGMCIARSLMGTTA